MGRPADGVWLVSAPVNSASGPTFVPSGGDSDSVAAGWKMLPGPFLEKLADIWSKMWCFPAGPGLGK